MISIMKQSGHTAYGLKEYVLDTPDDVEDLPINDPVGSTAFVISTSSVYMLNNECE